jgi:GNAT superfamily N-acetyltransferase
MNTNVLQYRQCQPRDATLLRGVAISCYTPYYRDLWEPGGMEAYLESLYEPVQLASELADPNLQFEIAYIGAQPVGFSKYHHRCDRADTPNAGYLERVYVAPQVNGQGVGRELIARLITTARDDGRDWIWLQAMTHASKPLARYRSLGFEECAQVRLSAPRVRPSEAAMVVMRLALTADNTAAPRR